MTSPPPLGVHAQGWGWQHPGRPRPAIENLDLVIEPGERVLLLGASGAGKTTLLHAIAGVLSEHVGARQWGTLRVGRESAIHCRGQLALLQQDPQSLVVLSRVGDDVAFGLENQAVPPEQIWPRVRESLEQVGLPLPVEHSTSSLSGGQKQRLGLAGMVAMRPGLWLLDEPTANIDSDSVPHIRDVIAESIADLGATLIVVEHRVDVWLPVVDRVVVLGGPGQDAVIADGPPGRVFSETAERLRSAGIWLPGQAPPTRPRHSGPSSTLLLEGSGLGVSHQSFTKRKRWPRARAQRLPPLAAENIDIRVHDAEAIAITGPNGAGKTALALTLGGLLPPGAGTVRAAEELSCGAGGDPLQWSGPVLIERIGTVFQEPEYQFITGSVAAELAYGPRMLGRALDVGVLAERLRLASLLEVNPFTLSGGEKRRLSVATALATNPDVLVLDEPTFGQDALTWAELATLLVELLDTGTSVVTVTHDVDFARALGASIFPVPAPRAAPLTGQL